MKPTPTLLIEVGYNSFNHITIKEKENEIINLASITYIIYNVFYTQDSDSGSHSLGTGSKAKLKHNNDAAERVIIKFFFLGYLGHIKSDIQYPKKSAIPT